MAPIPDPAPITAARHTRAHLTRAHLTRVTRALAVPCLLLGAIAGGLGAAQAQSAAPATAATTPATAPAFDLPTLMRELARQPGGQARFVETKTLALLDQPVVSRGTLVYAPPDRLEKNTLQPSAESMRVERDLVTVVRGGSQRQIRLGDYPEVLSIIEAVRGSLLGDLARLERHYEVKLGGQMGRWQLTLTPREPRLRRWVRHITVHGRQGRIDQIDTQQMDGDSAVMQITPGGR